VEEQNANIDVCIPVKSERARRLHALGVSLTALILLSVAYFLTPASGGVGTHQQLGLPQCGWIIAADIPCPTCGMTTAWSHTVRGNLPTAFMTQPMGMFLAIAAFCVAIGGLITACTGYSFKQLLNTFPPSKIFIVVLVLALIAWGFKILLHRGMI
jgi:hypothetical protein